MNRKQWNHCAVASQLVIREQAAAGKHPVKENVVTPVVMGGEYAISKWGQGQMNKAKAGKG